MRKLAMTGNRGWSPSRGGSLTVAISSLSFFCLGCRLPVLLAYPPLTKTYSIDRENRGGGRCLTSFFSTISNIFLFFFPSIQSSSSSSICLLSLSILLISRPPPSQATSPNIMRGLLVLLLGRTLLYLFSITVVSVCSTSLQEEQPDQGFDEYIPIIRVLCGEDEMTVQIDTAFERVHAFITATGARRLSTANITLGDGCLLVEDRPNNVG